MSRDHSLGLSREQTAAIIAGANSLPLVCRERFLSAVQDRVFGVNPITDHEVTTIISDLRDAFAAGYMTDDYD